MADRKTRGMLPPLTAAQRELVRGNIGLVAVHLRRHVGGLALPRRDREYEDLFQEGCLGLMRAAIRWDEASGIPFAAFAFPRIHNAISMGIKSKFLTVYVPPRRPDQQAAQGVDAPGTTRPSRPRESSLSDGQMLTLCATVASGSASTAETIGDRVREKYEHAVSRAVALLQGGASTRGDRDALLQVLASERLLVPNEESRRPLRQISRDTQSSYARVAQCNTRLTECVKTLLDQDPELAELLHLARASADGLTTPVDKPLELALSEAGAREYTRRFDAADEQDRGALLYALLVRTRVDMRGLLKQRFRKMDRDDREELLRHPALRDEARAGSSPRSSVVRSRSGKPRDRRKTGVRNART